MRLYGELIIPGDKSITHRAIMFNAISEGIATITNYLKSADILTTINILKNLGVEIEILEDRLVINGKGFIGLKKPNIALDCQNSGTTARLMMGLLSGLDFEVELIGDKSLSKRPMKRVTRFLEKLGINTQLTDDNYLPAQIKPSSVYGNEIFLDVSSAQVKSACILAALKCKSLSIIHEISSSRNHTELMLKYMGADISVYGLDICVSGRNLLKARNFFIPGDISSAAFFIVGCLITPNSEILIKNCGFNPTRTGIIKVLDMINANYQIRNKHLEAYEIVGDLYINYTDNLKPFTINKEIVSFLIDEIPILTLLATQIKGTSVISDANELRVKESDRIISTSTELKKLGADIIETNDGMIIHGKSKLIPNKVETYNDHRISMMLKIARLICEDIEINDDKSENISYPNFEYDLNKLCKY